MAHADSIQRFAGPQDLSLESLIERHGTTAGVDRYQIENFERSYSIGLERHKQRIEAIRTMIREAAKPVSDSN
jgi:hypothetical protein